MKVKDDYLNIMATPAKQLSKKYIMDKMVEINLFKN
jgi:hypothetical protein